MPLSERSEDVHAATVAMREENAAYLTANLEGKYTARYLAKLGDDAPHLTAEEMRASGSPLDAVGCNLYTATYVRSAADGYQALPLPANFPHMASEWLTVSPECMYWGPKLVSEVWKPRSIYITESGCSASGPHDRKRRLPWQASLASIGHLIAHFRVFSP